MVQRLEHWLFSLERTWVHNCLGLQTCKQNTHTYAIFKVKKKHKSKTDVAYALSFA